MTGTCRDEHELPPSGPWPETGLTRRARHDPRLGRLLTALQTHELELCADTESRASSLGNWKDVAEGLLQLAKEAVSQGRLDDSWEYLHASQRQAIWGCPDERLRILASGCFHESSSKLRGWRLKQALEVLSGSGLLDGAQPTDAGGGTDSSPLRPAADPREVLIEVSRMLNADSQNVYLRMRLLAKRLVVVATALFIIIVSLGALVTINAPARQPEVLSSGSAYSMALLLGAVGALISFAIGSMSKGADYRINELASGNYATTATRLLVGSAGALVAVAAVEAQVIAAPVTWAPIFAIAAGFSERLVRRIVESLSVEAGPVSKG